MKNVEILRRKGTMALIVLVFTGLLVSCNQDEALNTQNSGDVQLIEAIQAATNKEAVTVEDLPGSSQRVLQQEYNESYTEEAQVAPELGYQVALRKYKSSEFGERASAYFDINGRELLDDNADDGKRHPKGPHGKKRRHRGKDIDECFDFVYPVSIVFPPATTATVIEDETGLKEAMKSWHENNKGSEERPEIEFPLEITMGEERDTTITVNSIEELKAIGSDCIDKGPKRGKKRKCFEFVLPITMEMPDGTTIAINAKEDWEQIKAWHEANPEVEEKGKPQFPFDVTFKDGTTKTIENEEALEDLREYCTDKLKGIRDHCFKFVLPVTFTMPDGTEITVESREGFKQLKTWHRENPDVKEKGTPQFPVDIEYKDGTVVTVADLEELKRLREACDEDDEDDDGDDG